MNKCGPHPCGQAGNQFSVSIPAGKGAGQRSADPGFRICGAGHPASNPKFHQETRPAPPVFNPSHSVQPRFAGYPAANAPPSMRTGQPRLPSSGFPATSGAPKTLIGQRPNLTSLQPKRPSPFRMETRPAPPVYRPQGSIALAQMRRTASAIHHSSALPCQQVASQQSAQRVVKNGGALIQKTPLASTPVTAAKSITQHRILQPQMGARSTRIRPFPLRNRKVIQRAIAAAPLAGDLGDLNVSAGDPRNTPSKDMGNTSPVINARAPSYQVHIHNVGDGTVLAKVTLSQTALEGNNVSYYLKSGDHYTGFHWARGGVYDGAAARNRLVDAASPYADEYVYMVVSSSMSSLSRQAEQEHLDDFRRAFQISLQAAEAAIRAVIAGPGTAVGPDANAWYGPYADAGAANTAIANLVHQQLPAASQGLDLDQNNWLQGYQALCQKSQTERDGRGWHFFDLAESGWWRNSRFIRAVTESWDIYAEHPETQVHYVDVVAGGTQIGTHPTNQIIRF